ncbi:50S ribosomal protein L29 [Patescibacteria group bacterium]|nr:50S ribosomal protein L29 [Patescibacteria group bacterium]
MKIKEITQRSEKDLQKDLIEIREKLRQLKFDLSAGKVNNVREIRSIKKDIAKILTVLNSKKHA